MFYTLISKIPLISGDRTNKKFFKIFIFGSIAYILLHYYLHSGKNNEIMEKIKAYLYYAMVVDLMMAYYLSRPSIEDDESDNIRDGYSDDQTMEIGRDIEELKKMQMAQTEHNRQNVLEQQYLDMDKKNDTKSKSSQNSPFMTRDEIKENKHKKEKKVSSESSNKKTSESSSSSIPIKNETNKVTKDKKKGDIKQNDTDTVNIPIYIPKH